MTATLIGYQPSDETTYHFYKLPRKGVTGIERFDPEKKRTVVDPLPK